MPAKSVVPILEQLLELYPNPETELVHDNPYQLLVATMLSAQCTDKRVNMVTPALFAAFPTPQDLAQGPLDIVKEYIASINFFPTKAKNLIGMAQQLVLLHGSEVPQERAALEALPGVGRKTANVVLANAFGIPTLAVDTHVHRVANRLGWAKTTTPEKTEQALLKRVPKEWWIPGHHLLILHGRSLCTARSPKCGACPIQDKCPYGKKALRGAVT